MYTKIYQDFLDSFSQTGELHSIFYSPLFLVSILGIFFVIGISLISINKYVMPLKEYFNRVFLKRDCLIEFNETEIKQFEIRNRLNIIQIALNNISGTSTGFESLFIGIFLLIISCSDELSNGAVISGRLHGVLWSIFLIFLSFLCKKEQKNKKTYKFLNFTFLFILCVLVILFRASMRMEIHSILERLTENVGSILSFDIEELIPVVLMITGYLGIFLGVFNLIIIIKEKFSFAKTSRIIELSSEDKIKNKKNIMYRIGIIICDIILLSLISVPVGKIILSIPSVRASSEISCGFLLAGRVNNTYSLITCILYLILVLLLIESIFYNIFIVFFAKYEKRNVNISIVNITTPLIYFITSAMSCGIMYVVRHSFIKETAKRVFDSQSSGNNTSLQDIVKQGEELMKIKFTISFSAIIIIVICVAIIVLEVLLNKNKINYEDCHFNKNIDALDGETTIEDRAFNKDFYLDSIEIPDSVVSIGKYAFNECKALKNINIPNSVSTIGENAFSKCSALETVNLGNNVTDIGVKAFEECVNLKQINIPDSVINIGYGAFKGCTNIQGHIYLSDKMTVIRNGLFDGCKKLEKITIGHSTSRIEEKAFFGCEMLKEINIPDSVTSIYDYAFKDCKSLTALYLPDSLKHIGVAAFQECKSLIGIMLPSGLDKISESMFYGCTGLMAVNIPDSITRIGKNAFSKCSSLSNIEIPDSVSNIGYEAFSECSNLNDVIIPDSVVSIGVLAFYKCNSIVNINIPNSVNKLGVKAFAECAHLKNVKIGKAISVIDKAIFDKCEELEEVTISKNVLNIEAYAFGGCRSLKNIYFEGEKWKWCSIEKAPTWDKDTGNYTVHCTDGDIKK